MKPPVAQYVNYTKLLIIYKACQLSVFLGNFIDYPVNLLMEMRDITIVIHQKIGFFLEFSYFYLHFTFMLFLE